MDKQIGRYKLIRLIAKGGMGEVFLAYDPECKREIALKCIRGEYLENKIIYQRFIKEAYLASHLTHPNIIPIYSLSKESSLPYYTMPYIDGRNLKKILVETLEQEKGSQNMGPPVGSIQSLTHIFLTICQAVSYAHSQQIIHRDLKPENILIGKYGEVLIFDWGVADKIQNIAKEDPSYAIDELEFSHLTSPGKIIGTLSFLAPERFEGAPADYQTDIYSLGVMLYIILTLKLPFKRKNLKDIKKNIHKEVFRNPIDLAPYRDIPHALVNITEKCLAPDPKHRYKNMDELLKDLKSFVKGNSEWVKKDTLSFFKKEDWGFHENVLVSNHQAISQRPDAYEWISMMISKRPYSIHTRMELNVTLSNSSQGIGLLINATKASDRVHIFEGYNVWLSKDPKRATKLYRNNIEILSLPHITLNSETEYHVLFEQIDNRICLDINGKRQFSYLSYLALMGKYVGIIYKDTHFKIADINVFSASPSLVVSCLDVPDAFFENKNYDKALIEYRRVGHAFPGRHESREAFFRAGLTLLKKGQLIKEQDRSSHLLDEALVEFENLKATPGAPLEYLGKALVYFAERNSEEELKCLEFAILKYPKHPLLYLIYDHIIYRMYQSSHDNRIATHEFILLALRYNSYAMRKQMIDSLILNLAEKKGLYFFLSQLPEDALEENQLYRITINIGFLLRKTHVLKEVLGHCTSPILCRNILITLWFLKERDFLESKYKDFDPIVEHLFGLLNSKITNEVFETYLTIAGHKPIAFAENILFILIDKAFLCDQLESVGFIIRMIRSKKVEIQQKESLNKLALEYFLLTHNFEEAALELKSYKSRESEIHFDKHFLEGCYIHATQGLDKALNFFSTDIETSIPHLGILACLYLSKNINIEKWSKTAFQFELMTLYRQVYIFYQAGGNDAKARIYLEKWKKYSDYS